MFTKKSLNLTLACVLLIGLALMGVAYGAWTETLNLSGDVVMGEVKVEFIPNPGWYDADMEGALEDHHCQVTTTATTLTIKVDQAYPGYMCIIQSGGVINTGSLPAKIQQPVLLNNTSPWPPFFGLVWEDDTILPVGETIYFDLNFEIPYNIGNEFEKESYEFVYTLEASQAR